jgi:hemerythrin superfamily protein
MATKATTDKNSNRKAANDTGGRFGGTGIVLGAAAAGIVAGVVANLGRKAIVQAPTALAGDWFEGLKAEHKMALGLFDAIQATKDEQTVRRTVLLTQLKHALGKHAFTEENVIYPELRDNGEAGDADELNTEHGYVKQYLYDLEQLDNSSPEFLKKVAAFRGDLEDHIRDEETRIFPALHAKLGEKNKAVTAAANKEGFKLA